MAKVTLDLMLRCVADKSSYSSTVLNLLLHKLSMSRGDPGVTLALLQVDSDSVLTLRTKSKCYFPLFIIQAELKNN